jgi:hypothetical protein
MARDAAARRSAPPPPAPVAADKPDPSIDWMDITPAMAEAWLRDYNAVDPTTGKRNRNIRPQDVAKWVRIMRRGQWKKTVEPIKFSEPRADGSVTLLDGQHRLAAIRDSRMTVRLPVATNVPEDAQDSMDSGVKRTVGDKLGMRGVRNSNNAAGIARLVWDTQDGTSNKPPRPSDNELLEIVDSDPDLLWVAEDVMTELPKILSQTIAGYCYLQMHKVNADATLEFFTRLKTLTELPEGSPIAALARRTGQFKKYTHKDRIQVICMVFNAWNAWRQGETRERIMAKQFKDGHYEIPKLV